jgi:hypothetical protein
VTNQQVDVVVRFQDTAQLSELSRCVFSLAGQTHRPLHIIIATERFSDGESARTKAALAPMLESDPEIKLTIVNWSDSEPADASSLLLNLGVQSAHGKYLAFIDHDGVLYPDAYALLIERLRQTRAAIAFASVRLLKVQIYEQFLYPTERIAPPVMGKKLMDLFRSKFCPIHACLIDRERVDPGLISFNGGLAADHDYDMLLRICARYLSDFSLINTMIGDAYVKDDEAAAPIPAFTPEIMKSARAAIEHRKRTTAVANDVLQSLGIPTSPRLLSIRDVVERYA